MQLTAVPLWEMTAYTNVGMRPPDNVGLRRPSRQIITHEYSAIFIASFAFYVAQTRVSQFKREGFSASDPNQGMKLLNLK